MSAARVAEGPLPADSLSALASDEPLPGHQALAPEEPPPLDQELAPEEPLPADEAVPEPEPLHGERPQVGAAAAAHRLTTYRVAVIPGDGIGPDVIGAAQRVLEDAATRYGFRFEWTRLTVGGAAIDAFGTPIRDEDLDVCARSDAVLLGACGGPKWDNVAPAIRPEQALFRLRKTLGLFANLRPVAAEPALIESSPLRPERLRGVDMLIVRELTGGLYFGERQEDHATPTGRSALDTLPYSEPEIRRIAQLAFELARGRRHHLTSVDKANVLATSRLWRSIVTELGREFPDVDLDHRLVDSCAMQLVTQPADFDVIVTENMFGDILSDEASVLAGSLGMLPSASLGARRTDYGIFGLYEPVHGSAPDIAGQDLANPAAAVLSGAMMLRWSFGQAEAAAAVEGAVRSALADGYRTGDLIGPPEGDTAAGLIRVGTTGFRDAVLERMGSTSEEVEPGPTADADLELLV